jgi:hypothetical protein
MASDDIQLARLLDEGWPARPAAGPEPDPCRVRLAHRLSRRLAAVRLPPLPTRTRQPHPSPQTPPRHEPHRGAALSDVPEQVLQTARRAVHQLGNGLFGVDLRQQGQGCVLLEIIDNPWIRGDIEDREAKDLYERLARAFRQRLENRGRARQDNKHREQRWI